MLVNAVVGEHGSKALETGGGCTTGGVALAVLRRGRYLGSFGSKITCLCYFC
jgi:hypothetical protein